MKKKILSFVFVMTLLISQTSIYASTTAYDYDNVYDVANVLKPQIQKALSKESNNYTTGTSEKKISFMAVKNVDLQSESSYQTLHNILQDSFPSREMVDIYITSNGQVIIPTSNKPRIIVNESASCTKQDIYFKQLLKDLGVNDVYIVDCKNVVKLSSLYHNSIVNAVKNVYNKYISLSNGYINTKSNPLFTRLDMQDINVDHAIAEFVGDNKVIHLSTGSFSKVNNKNTNLLTAYSIYHEMGHSLEMILCQKAFKDLNLSNISSEDIERLSTVAFESQSISVSTEFMNTILSKMNAPTDPNSRRQFISKNLTQYSTTNPAEFFAEAVTSGLLNISNSKQISTLLDEEIKLFFNKQGTTYNNVRSNIIKFLKSECGMENI